MEEAVAEATATEEVVDEEPKEDNEFPVCCRILSPSWARYSFVKPKTVRFPLKSNPTSRTRTVVWKVLTIKESAITARSQPNPTSFLILFYCKRIESNHG